MCIYNVYEIIVIPTSYYIVVQAFSTSIRDNDERKDERQSRESDSRRAIEPKYIRQVYQCKTLVAPAAILMTNIFLICSPNLQLKTENLQSRLETFFWNTRLLTIQEADNMQPPGKDQ